jgi:hypothetical protein
MGDNDNSNDAPKPTVVLDAHRGMAAQKATDARRSEAAVKADQEAVREGQSALEKHLFAGPARTWAQAADKAAYLLRLFAATPAAQDPRYRQLIEDALDDLQRLGRDR